MKVFNLLGSALATLFIGSSLLAQTTPQSTPGQATQTGQAQATQQGQAQATQQGQAQATQQGQLQPGQGRVNQQGTTVQAGQAGQAQGGQSEMIDQMAAHCLALANQEEIALAQFVREKLENTQAQQFASTMIQEHQQFLQKLQQAAPQVTNITLAHDQSGQDRSSNARAQSSQSTTPGRSATNVSPTNQSQNQPANTQPTQRGQTTSGTATGRSQFSTASAAVGSRSAMGTAGTMMQIQEEIAQECLQGAKQMLGQHQGAELDKAYLGHQIVAHGQMKAKLTVLQRHVSGELQTLVNEGLQTTERHMQQAVQLMESLAKNDSTKQRNE